MIKVENLCKNFQSGLSRESVPVVKNISFKLAEGETLGLVGESGCGKTTLSRTMLGLTEVTSGQVYFNDEPVFDKKGRVSKDMRGRMQIIFQHPESALNPRMTIEESLYEPLKLQGKKSKQEAKAIVDDLIKEVGLGKEHFSRYPGELSGGQIQRVVLARILSIGPDFVIADEPTSMLDASVQAQVIEILSNLQKESGMAMLFISHDLDLVRRVCDRVAVMYRGRIVEIFPAYLEADKLVNPYARFLMGGIGDLNDEYEYADDLSQIGEDHYAVLSKGVI